MCAQSSKVLVSLPGGCLMTELIVAAAVLLSPFAWKVIQLRVFQYDGGFVHMEFGKLFKLVPSRLTNLSEGDQESRSRTDGCPIFLLRVCPLAVRLAKCSPPILWMRRLYFRPTNAL